VGKLADRLETLKQLRGPLFARLDAALGRPGGPEPPWPESIPHEPVAATREQLAEWMNRSNPQLLAMDRETARAKHRIELARKDYFPDATVGATYIDTAGRVGAGGPSDSGQDPIIGMITVNVPIWWRKLSAAVREARSRYWAALRGRKQTSHDLTARLRMTLYQLQDAERKIALYRGTLLPKARESLKVTQTGFAAGTSSFTDLIDAQRVLLEFELAHQRALTDHAARRADLEQMVGRHIPSRGNSQSRPSVD
jgi:outer membrane protein TolC